MTTSIILINVKRSMLKEATEQVKNISGVTEVYTVAGEYDLVAMLRLKDSSNLSTILTDEMSSIEGITHTKTLFALDVMSNFDLDKIFS
ncbi:MAG TPA: Lrp/AsnC ligand binding domain-containing protein [Victivallales bacterium]|nr:Lrp/AsnC ligand binding domain-containing protein [Victivallales bacterium]